MSIVKSIGISASALTAQRTRMDVIASNIANAETTRAEYVNGQWQPYRRKSVILSAKEGGFSSYLHAAMGKEKAGEGVAVKQIAEDDTPFKMVYDPEHPDADESGYVRMPNVDPLREMVDLLSATRSYEANVTVLNASKAMLMKALEIGR